MSLLSNGFKMSKRAGGGVFSPADLSPVAWFDASDATTLFDSTTGGSLAAADGSVRRWETKVGSNHARLFTYSRTSFPTSIPPVRRTAAVNGMDALEFDIATLKPDYPWLTSGPGSIYMVSTRFADPPPSGTNWMRTGTVAGRFGQLTDGEHVPFSNGNIAHSFGSTQRKIITPAVSFLDPRIYGIKSATNDWRFRIDGSDIYTTTANTVTWSSWQNFGLTINAGGGEPFYVWGDVCEIVIFDRILTASEENNLETYLTRWQQ